MSLRSDGAPIDDARRRRATPGSAGFTLLELMVVLAIIALIAAVAAPRLVTPIAFGDEARASRQIADALRRTRLYALRSNRPADLVIDVEARRLALPNGKRIELPAGIRLSIYTADDLAIDDTQAAIRFYPDGSSTGGRIAVGEEDKDDVRTVAVDWLTGRIDATR